MDGLTEPALVALAKTGDHQAFGRLVLASQDAVRGFLAVRLRDRHQVDDLAQETYLTAYRRLETFRDGESFAAWVRGIAHNQLRVHLRRRRQTKVEDGADLELLVDEAAAAATDAAAANQLLAALRTCVGQLAAQERALVRRRYLDGVSIAELSR